MFFVLGLMQVDEENPNNASKGRHSLPLSPFIGTYNSSCVILPNINIFPDVLTNHKNIIK
jgi:hypothetical protein